MSWTTVVSRVTLCCLIWWFLTDAAASSWWIGLPAVLLAVIASLALIPPASIVWYEFLWFVPFFLWRSMLGGADVAWRAFHPAMPIAPDLVEYHLRLPPGLAQVFMINTVSLLPGTLCASLDQNVLTVHVLSQHKGFFEELETVEHRVARVFGATQNISVRGE